MRHLFALLGLVAALGATGCDRIASVNVTVSPAGPSVIGEGEVKKETRQTLDFDKISVSSIIHAHYTQGPKQVTVSAQPNLMSHVVTRVERGVLIIELTGQVNDAKQIDVTVSSPTLTGAEASGASSIELLNAVGSDCALSLSGTAQMTGATNYDTLALDLSGSSSATLSGSASTVQIEASGSSQADLSDLKSQRATASASGASDLKLNVQRSLTATASGASNIAYSGSPQSVVRNVDGAAQVDRA